MIACLFLHHASVDASLIGLDGFGITQLQRISDQRVTDGDFCQTGRTGHKSSQVVTVQVMPCVDAQARIQRSLRGLGIGLQLLLLIGLAPVGGKRLGVQLYAVGTHGFGGGHLLRNGVHEQTHAHA